MHLSRYRLIAALAAAAAATLAGCSPASPPSPSPTGVATNPPVAGSTGTVTPTPGASGAQTSGDRTVLVQDGLRIHTTASLSAGVEGTAAWGVTLTVVGYDASGGPWPGSTSPGAWYQVQGSTVTGWIVADPAYTASGVLTPVGFQDKQIDGVLFPSGWTYADDSGEVIFQPQAGTDPPTLLIREAATLSALGPAGLTGYASVTSNSEVVACGYTGTLVTYAAAPNASPQPTTDPGGGSVTRLSEFAQFRATLSPTYALDVEMNYSTPAEYSVFQDLLDSIRYPFPDCEAPTPTPSATT